MKSIIIIHGTYGSPEGNWFSRLKERLEEKGYEVIVPRFPTPKNQRLSAWLDVIRSYEDTINEETILIGHSLGAAFVLSILEQQKTPIKGSILVSGFLGILGNSEYDDLNKTFTTKKFNREKIKAQCESFILVNGDNDPYVPLEKGKELERILGGEMYVINGGGHLNTDSGYNTFPLIEELVDSLQ